MEWGLPLVISMRMKFLMCFTDWNKTWLLLSDGFGQWYDAGHQYDLVSNQSNRAWSRTADVDNDGDLDIWVGYGPIALMMKKAGFSEMGFIILRYQPDSLFIQEEDTTDGWDDGGLTEIRLPEVVWADHNNDIF